MLNRINPARTAKIPSTFTKLRDEPNTKTDTIVKSTKFEENIATL